MNCKVKERKDIYAQSILVKNLNPSEKEIDAAKDKLRDYYKRVTGDESLEGIKAFACTKVKEDGERAFPGEDTVYTAVWMKFETNVDIPYHEGI